MSESAFGRRRGGEVRAVDDVSLDIEPGETLGLVGESGSGKSTLGRLVLRLIQPTSGSVLFEGRDLLAANHNEMRRLRRDMQIIFQDPFGSLDPRMRVEDVITEPLIIHESMTPSSRRTRVTELLRAVGLDESSLRRFPHEFSGGQRQRIGIARALALGLQSAASNFQGACMTSIAVTPVPEAAPPLSQGQRIINTFIAPSKTFADLRRSASWWLPFLLMSLCSLLYVYVVDQKIGFRKVA